MLKNAYFLSKIGADAAENERNFAKFLPNICQKKSLPNSTLALPASAPGTPRTVLRMIRSAAGIFDAEGPVGCR